MATDDRPKRSQRIKPYDPGGGSDRADRALQGISRMFGGYIPNMHKVMANSPAMIEAFEAMRRLLQRSKISPLERELISIEVSRRNGCEYCMSVHKYLAARLRLSDEDITRAARGRLVVDQHAALVQRATHNILDRKGRLTDQQLEGFREQGLGDDELVEIIAVIGWYVMSTYTNNLAQTEIDELFQKP